MARSQNFQYAELPIMRYRVFDSGSRQFSNVPIQPLSNPHWLPQEDEPYEILPDEGNYEELQDSDDLNQQPLHTEENMEEVLEEIEIIDDLPEDPPLQNENVGQIGADGTEHAVDKDTAETIVDKPADEPVAEPAAELAVGPIDEPAVEPAVKPVDEPIDEPAVEPIEEPIEERLDQATIAKATADQLADDATNEPVNKLTTEDTLESEPAGGDGLEAIKDAKSADETEEEGSPNPEGEPAQSSDKPGVLVTDPIVELSENLLENESPTQPEPTNPNGPSEEVEYIQGDDSLTETSAPKEQESAPATDAGLEHESIEFIAEEQSPEKSGKGEIDEEVVESAAPSGPSPPEVALAKTAEGPRRKKKDKKSGNPAKKKKKVTLPEPVTAMEIPEKRVTESAAVLNDPPIQEPPSDPVSMEIMVPLEETTQDPATEEILPVSEELQLAEELSVAVDPEDKAIDTKDLSETMEETIHNAPEGTPAVEVPALGREVVALNPEPQDVLEVVKDMQEADASDKDINEVLEKALSEVGQSDETEIPVGRQPQEEEAEARADGINVDKVQREVPGSFPQSHSQEVLVAAVGNDSEPVAEHKVTDTRSEPPSLEEHSEYGDAETSTIDADGPAPSSDPREDKIDVGMEDIQPEALDVASKKELAEESPGTDTAIVEGSQTEKTAAPKEMAIPEEKPTVEEQAANDAPEEVVDKAPGVISEAPTEKPPEETLEVAPEAAPEASSEVTPEVPAEKAPEAAPDVNAEKAAEVTPEVPAEKDSEVPSDQAADKALEEPVKNAPEAAPAQPEIPPSDGAVLVTEGPTATDVPADMILAEEILPSGEPAPPSSPDTNKDKPSRRQHYRAKDRDRQISITNGHNAILDRKKTEKGLFTNIFGRAVKEATETGKQKRDTDDYRAKEKRRRERRDKRVEDEREKERLAKEARRGERKKQRDADEAERLAREARRDERRKQRDAERLAAEAEAAASPPPSPRSEKRRGRRSSFAASTSSGGAGPVRPALMRRLTIGESEHGGPLLKLNFNKVTEEEEAPRWAPTEDKGKEPERGSAEKKRHHRHREEGQRRSKEKEGEGRSMSSRQVSSRSHGGRSHRSEDEVPAVKLRNAIGRGLKSVFAY